MKSFLLFTAFLYSSLIFAQNALNFDGVDDNVQTTFPGVLGNNDRTFEAWVNVPSGSPTTIAVCDYGTNAVGSRNTFLIGNDRSLRFISGGTNANILSAAGVVPEDQWVHVAFVLDNATGYLYVNGSQVFTGNLSTVNTPSGNTNLIIGQRVSGGSTPFFGSIDEVRIWDVALSEQEINLFMNSEFCSNPTGLVAYYKMNQGTAGMDNSSIMSLTDEISSNDGVFNNMALNGSVSNFVNGSPLTSTFTTNQTIELCAEDSIVVGSNVYNVTGNYSDVFTSVLTGCDSTVNTNLTMKAANINNQTLNECDGFTVTVGSNTYSTSGVFHDTLTSVVDGCDSVVVTDLTISNLDNTTSTSGITITSNEAGATYTWLDCDNGNSVISGESSQSFTASTNGNYAVVVSNGMCSDTSDCVAIASVGLEEEPDWNFNVYPNPVRDNLNIQIGNSEDVYHVVIYNNVGQVVIKTNESSGNQMLNVSDLSNGIYTLVIYSLKVEVKRIQFIKQ